MFNMPIHHHRLIYSPQNKHKHTKNIRGRLPERHKHPSTLAALVAHCDLRRHPAARSSPERPLPATGIPTHHAQGWVRVSLTASAWRRRRAAN